MIPQPEKQMHKLSTGFLTAAVFLTLLVVATAGEEASLWPQHRGNSGSTGVSSDESLKPPFKLVWSYRCDSDTTGDAGAGLTVGGGKVYCNMAL